MKFTSMRVSVELRDLVKKLCKTKYGKVTPDEYLRKKLGLGND